MVFMVPLTDSNARVRIGCLHKFFALVPHHPVGISLCGSLGVQVHHLELAEVSDTDGSILWACVKEVRDAVVVKVILTGISPTVT